MAQAGCRSPPFGLTITAPWCPTPELSGAARKPRHGAKTQPRVRLSERLGGRGGRASRGCRAFALCSPHSAQYAEYRYCALRPYRVGELERFVRPDVCSANRSIALSALLTASAF